MRTYGGGADPCRCGGDCSSLNAGGPCREPAAPGPSHGLCPDRAPSRAPGGRGSLWYDDGDARSATEEPRLVTAF